MQTDTKQHGAMFYILLKSVWLHLWALFLAGQFARGGERSDIDDAIDLGREALELFPPDHPRRSAPLVVLLTHLRDRYHRFGDMMDLQEAIVLTRQVLDIFPTGNISRLTPLNILSGCLSIRYEKLGALADLDEAIALNREALELWPRGESAPSLNDVANRLSNRRQQLGEMEQRHKSVVLTSEAMSYIPQRSLRSDCLIPLMNHLVTRYREFGAVEDIHDAIIYGREALELCSEGHPDRWIALSNLASCLTTRFQELGMIEDINDAVMYCREALNLCPTEHRERSISIDNLALCLLGWYEQVGEMEYIEEAISLSQEALNLCPPGHPGRLTPLVNLGKCLVARYEQLGVMEDIDQAIILTREAVDLCLLGNPSRSTPLNNLGLYLSARYVQLGAIEDLNEAVAVGKEALDLCQEGHPDRWKSLMNLGSQLRMRYEQLGEVEDIDVAVVFCRRALELRSKPNKTGCLGSLARCLITRYKQLKVMNDLAESIILYREAVDTLPQGHPDRRMPMSYLGFCLSARYEQLGGVKDIDEAIVLSQEAFGLCPPGFPNRSAFLTNLTLCLHARFTRLRHEEDEEALFGVYSQLVDVPQMVHSMDLSAARAWTQAAEEFQHPSTLLAYKTFLRLLIQHLAALPSLPQHRAVLRDLTSSIAVDGFSACLRNGALVDAVELLEQGRSVFWNQLARLRSPLDDVIATGPAGKTLAEEFTRLASLIRTFVNSPDADRHERVCHLNVKLQGVVNNIRELPGLTRFLLPSLFSDFRCAASEGPVIIVNASKYSCDALVVLFDLDPVRIPLQVTQEDARELSAELRTLTIRATKSGVTKELAFFLRKLWDQIVSPIINFLQTILPPQSRIWWCPTAEFSALPLHAAGPFRKGQMNLTEIYISSYTPTLTALIQARRCRDSPNSKTDMKRFVAIGQAKASGENELLSVGTELANIGQLVSSLATFTLLDGPESSVPRVAQELAKNEWVHFACHGLPDRKRPFESAFALKEGHLTIQLLIGCELENPEFAYLSACHTTVGDEENPDEVIHLASAMQFAGFRSVIGTMWAVDDGETNKITSTFYKHMVDESGRLDYTRAAFALNKTMRLVNIPFDQRVLYIHLGA